MKEESKILGTFSGHSFEDGYRHKFSSLLSRFGLHLGLVFGVKVGKMDTKKHSKNRPAKKSRRPAKEIPGDLGADRVVP